MILNLKNFLNLRNFINLKAFGYCSKSDFSKNYLESLYNEWSDYLEKDNKNTKQDFGNTKKIYTRGKTGVFDLEELVESLKEEFVTDIFCVKIPFEYKYADFLVIGSCKTKRHLLTSMENINKIYKAKKNSKDSFITVEGAESKSDWLAVDMSNIVLHLFLPETRKLFDLETLWSVGPKFDDHLQNRIRNDRKYNEIDIDWESVAKQKAKK